MHLPIHYLDKHFVIAEKPAGLLVHRSWLDKHETTFMLQRLRDQLGQYLYPVHRLDRPTSGLLLFALNEHSARALKIQFDTGQIEKRYLAIVRGYVDSQTIDHPLTVKYDKIADAKRRRDHPAQHAQTQLTTLAQTELPFASSTRYSTSRYSLVQLQPKTGRKHQLRRHLKHIAHPIVGDTAYGDLRQNKAFAEHLQIQRLMLHAYRLDFPHPHSQEKLSICAYPKDTDWQRILAKFIDHTEELFLEKT